LVYFYAFILLNVDVEGCAIGNYDISLTSKTLKKKTKVQKFKETAWLILSFIK